ncbi:MAG: hypothetical protein WCF84_25385 [Anaerolineae bacterium]
MRVRERFPLSIPSLDALDAGPRVVLERTVDALDAVEILQLPPFDLVLMGRALRKQFIQVEQRTTPERIVVQTDDRLLILSGAGGDASFDLVQIPIRDILAFEWACILVHSWIQITWEEVGRVVHTRLDFNSVGVSVVRGLLSGLQAAALGPMYRAGAEPSPEPPPEIMRLPMKFMNAVRLDTLLSGEQVLASVFDPGDPPGRLFRRGRERQLWLATNYHGTLIRQPLEMWPYGQVIQIYPRTRVNRVGVNETERGVVLELTLGKVPYVTESIFPRALRSALVSSTESLHLAIER